MHRGSSKGVRATPREPETLPLSASPAPSVEVVIARAGRETVLRLPAPPGTLVRSILRAAGQAPEGSAVLVDDVSIPLDTPVDGIVRIVVLPTFSGG